MKPAPAAHGAGGMGAERVMCYVALKACGCAVAAAVDKTEYAKDTAKTIAKWIRDGLAVERKPVEWARENLMRCTHDTKSCKARSPA